MVATPDLGSGAERRGGSSPFIRTSDCHSAVAFLRLKELVRSVAVWQCCLRLSNVQSCCATLEYRLRNICSNEFGIYSQPIFQTFGFPAHSPRLHYSNLRRPFESFHLFDNLQRCRTSDCHSAVAFLRLKALGQSVAVWQSNLWSAIIAVAIFCL